MTMPQPQPGDIYECAGELREVIYADPCRIHMQYRVAGEGIWEWMSAWNRWQSGATLVERKEPTR